MLSTPFHHTSTHSELIHCDVKSVGMSRTEKRGRKDLEYTTNISLHSTDPRFPGKGFRLGSLEEDRARRHKVSVSCIQHGIHLGSRPCAP